jgi:putative hemolysin
MRCNDFGHDLSQRSTRHLVMRSTMSTLTPARKKHLARANAIKRSVYVDGHKTSVSLENEFWDGLREVARHKNLTASAWWQRSPAVKIVTISRLQSACSFSIISERNVDRKYFRTSPARTARPQARPPLPADSGPTRASQTCTLSIY